LISIIPERFLATRFTAVPSLWFGPNISIGITDGIAAERQIKGWSRAKKEALIQGDWTAISQLSRRGGKLRQR
jgi:predicted GIY-YIG superfamily endonuclease